LFTETPRTFITVRVCFGSRNTKECSISYKAEGSVVFTSKGCHYSMFRPRGIIIVHIYTWWYDNAKNIIIAMQNDKELKLVVNPKTF
jgi:hypothetical protein